MTLIELKNLSIEYSVEGGGLQAVDGIDMSINNGETIGVVGESGCGKSTLAMGLLQILDQNGRVTDGEVLFKNKDLTALSDKQLQDEIRWKEISWIPQNAMNALDPVKKIGNQIAEVIRVHTDSSRSEAHEQVQELLQSVNIDPERAHDYPHELSGGQRQRVIIAYALALEPSLIIADEITTGLDVMVQNDILNLLSKKQDELDCGMIFITHDISAVTMVADYIAVMYGGRLMEFGTLENIFHHASHPYTIGLKNSFPTLDIDPGTTRLVNIPGTPPSLLNPPSGCRFVERCPFSTERCTEEPPTNNIDETHRSKCHYVNKSDEFREYGRLTETWENDEQ